MHPSQSLPPNYQRIGTTPEQPKYYAESPPMAPPNARYLGLESHQFATIPPSIGKRVFRAVARFFFAVLIGIGATLAWQSFGSEADQMVRTWAPSIGWLLPEPTMTPAAASASDLAQQLKPMSLDLVIVRRSLDQLAARQEQIAQSVVTLQGIEQDISQEMSSLTLSQTAHIPHKPPLPNGQPLR
jgi:hypothetical protein